MEDNLDEILLGGQTFSWKKNDDGSFSSVLGGKVRRITRLEDAYDDPFLYDYFDLGYDYEKAKREIREKDEILKEAVDAVGTLRILRQDHFTATISFILSQNNNIKRITGLYERLSRRYGREVDEDMYSFPTPDEMKDATEEELRALGVGFRAPFILDAIAKCALLDEVDHELVRDKLACIHVLLRLETKRRSGLDGSTQKVAGRDVRDAVVGNELLGLSALARSGRAKQYDVHLSLHFTTLSYLKNPS